MFELNVIIQLAPVFTREIAFRTGEMAGIRGLMSFPAMFSIITGSSLEMVTNWSCFLKGGRVDGRVNGRVGGRVDGRVWRGGGSVTDGRGNFIGIFTDFNFAMFFQHMRLETLISFTFEFTVLTLKLKLHWGGGIVIGRVNISGFFYVSINDGFNFFCG